MHSTMAHFAVCRSQRTSRVLVYLVAGVACIVSLSTVHQALSFQSCLSHRATSTQFPTTVMTFLQSSTKDEEDPSDSDDGSYDDSNLFESLNEEKAQKVNSHEEKKILDEIAWRSKKVELEEANTRRFQKMIKSKPWKLPYDDASIWVQKNLGVDTEEEFMDLVENGNLRTPYIPKNPERYYNGTSWISWTHFLTGEKTEEM